MVKTKVQADIEASEAIMQVKGTMGRRDSK